MYACPTPTIKGGWGMVEGEGVEEEEPLPPSLPVGVRVALGVEVGPPTPEETVGAPVGAPEVGVAPPLAPPDPVGSTGAWV